jgi:DNA helicase-2/ATP-dependent DNA helicase PcrA
MFDNNTDYLKGLNEVQREATTTTEGPVMIIAGAGSGKTRVITHRIVHLLKHGIDSFNILTLTFTNKASREMKDRIAKLIGNDEAKNLWMGTFHSVFAKILRIESERIGYPSNFTIYDTADAKNLIKAIIKEAGLSDEVYKPNLVYNRISAAKNNLISWKAYQNNQELVSEDHSSQKPKLGTLYELYQKRLFASASMDFDDLLFNTNVLFRDCPDVLNKYQHKFKYVMVDEYQDTNYAQYLIVRKLAAAFENVCVVGDDSQSIYAFRGANIQNILNFKKDYPNAKTFNLEQNYRSTKVIVNAANSIIKHNQNQLKKTIWTDNLDGDKIKVIRTYSDTEEGWNIAQSIFDIKNNAQAHNKEFAILYRTNAQSRAMEEALRKMNIDYRVYGGLSFYQRKEIKDLLAYFRLTLNHNDEESLKRVINYPARGIGQTTIDRIVLAAGENNTSLWAVIENIAQYNTGINNGIMLKISDFVAMIKSFSVMVNTHEASTLAEHIAKHSGILREMYNDKSPEGVSRYENIQELLNGVKEFTEDDVVRTATERLPEEPVLSDNEKSLAYFMQDIALLTDSEEKDKDGEEVDKVTMMTIHAAKGLEFPYVFVVGMEENLFPSQLSINNREDLEEERRLFYVAITRAEKKLTLSYATSRFRFGSLISCEPSRFLEEMDQQFLEMPAAPKRNSSFDDEPQNWGGFGGFGSKTIYKKTTTPTPTAPAPKPVPPSVPKNLTKLTNTSSSATSNTDLPDLSIGLAVEHARFGRGQVILLEGVGQNQKATIDFGAHGKKQLILKFAKLKVLP